MVMGKTVEIVLTEDNHVSFNQAVMPMYVAAKSLEILQKSAKLPPNQPLYLILFTPGGSVSAGLNFIDLVKSTGRPVHTITIFAASMGYQMVQELGNRYIIPSGILMSHRGHVSGLEGQVPGELNARLLHIQRTLGGMAERAAKRTGMKLSDYQQAITNELWFSGTDAVKLNHADAVAVVKCTKDLVSGTRTETVASPFGEAKVTFSKCPMISMPIGISFDNATTPEQKQNIKRFIGNQLKQVNLTL